MSEANTDGGEIGGGPMSQDGQSLGNAAIVLFPNPFTERLNITRQIAGQHNTELKVYDVTGRLVKQFDPSTSGQYDHVIWDGRDGRGHILPGGVYFMKLTTGDYSTTEKLLLIR